MESKTIEILVQSHNEGWDITEEDYQYNIDGDVEIVAVFSNQVTGYCGGEDHSAVGKTASSPKELMELVGKPAGFQHCRLEIVLKATT